MTHKPRFAVILSGCGVFDGAEIHESVLTLLAIDRVGGSVQCFAPDRAQHHVIDHRSGAILSETRNVLVEAARIARGAILPLDQFDPQEVDALVLPGGFGVAKNLSSFAFDGEACHVEPSVERALVLAHQAGLPIAALCIAPALLARVFGAVTLTIGDDPQTAETLRKCGATPLKASPTEVVVDYPHKIVTSPCYMNATSLSQVAQGIDEAIKATLSLIA